MARHPRIARIIKLVVNRIIDRIGDGGVSNASTWRLFVQSEVPVVSVFESRVKSRHEMLFAVNTSIKGDAVPPFEVARIDPVGPEMERSILLRNAPPAGIFSQRRRVVRILLKAKIS